MKALPVLFCSLVLFGTAAFATEAVLPEQVPYYKDYKRDWFLLGDESVLCERGISEDKEATEEDGQCLQLCSFL